MPETTRPAKLALLKLTLKADLARNTALLDRLTVIVFRLGQYAITKPAPVRWAWRIIDLAYVQLLIGAELPPTVQCGPGLRLPHAGRGVILHPQVRIGAGAVLYHRVTIGVRGDGAPPVLGDRVYAGTGASIIGPVAIGDDARIGAGAVVIRDIPAGCTAAGVPAAVMPARRDR